jgi:hypothetical protein
MHRLLIISLNLFYTSIGFAASNQYQVDLILFAQRANSNTPPTFTSPMTLTPHAMSLKAAVKGHADNYQLLSQNLSSLRSEYYALHKKPQYEILGQYSWKQPTNSRNSVALPPINIHGWHLDGTVSIKKTNYFILKAELSASPPSNPQSYFRVTQNQRLKENTVYYLDHAQIGMLIKVHQ